MKLLVIELSGDNPSDAAAVPLSCAMMTQFLAQTHG